MVKAELTNYLEPPTREEKAAFFNYVAHDLGFHAEIDSDTWSSVVIEDIVSYKVCYSVLS